MYYFLIVCVLSKYTGIILSYVVYLIFSIFSSICKLYKKKQRLKRENELLEELLELEKKNIEITKMVRKRIRKYRKLKGYG